MTDRELLELAAKAAGIAWSQEYQCYLGEPDVNGVRVKWLPLTDDGDALRLAVKLRRFPVIELWSDGGLWVFMLGDERNAELLGTDPYAATRRAIVRAAAEIGRNKT
jgi:hypothetical protein